MTCMVLLVVSCISRQQSEKFKIRINSQVAPVPLYSGHLRLYSVPFAIILNQLFSIREQL